MYSLKQVAFKDVLHIEALDIPAGVVTCIVGESGGGKSTLLRLLNQLISADSGDIRFRGEPIGSLDPVGLRRRVVMVPQAPVLFGDSVRDNLTAGPRFAGKEAPSEERMLEAMKLVHLDKPLDASAGSFSGGEKQRLSLARAWLLEPEAFLLDEPSSALDEGTEDLVIGAFVEGARKNGQTLIIVTHAKKIAEQYGDRIVEIGKGRIVGIRIRTEEAPNGFEDY